LILGKNTTGSGGEGITSGQLESASGFLQTQITSNDSTITYLINQNTERISEIEDLQVASGILNDNIITSSGLFENRVSEIEGDYLTSSHITPDAHHPSGHNISDHIDLDASTLTNLNGSQIVGTIPSGAFQGVSISKEDPGGNTTLEDHFLNHPTGSGSISHSDLSDMPSSTNSDHDGRYYTEAESDALIAAHAALQDVHHPKDHTLASHTTKNHSDLDNIGPNDHHPQVHDISGPDHYGTLPEVTALNAASGYLHNEILANDSDIIELQEASGSLNTRLTTIEGDYLTSVQSGILQSGITTNADNISLLNIASGNLDTRLDTIEEDYLTSEHITEDAHHPRIHAYSTHTGSVPSGAFQNVAISVVDPSGNTTLEDHFTNHPGMTDHAMLSNLDYDNSGHTGFVSDSTLVTSSGVLVDQIEASSGILQVQITNNDSDITDLQTASGIIRTTQTTTLDPTGFSTLEETSLSFDNETRTFTLVDNGDGFSYWRQTRQVTKSGNQTVVIPNSSGLHYIYFDSNDDLVSSQEVWSFDGSVVPVATVYWDPQGSGYLLHEERHGVSMSWATHKFINNTIGVAYDSGLTGTFNNDNTFVVTAGKIYDCDLEISIEEQTTCRIFYSNGTTGYWNFDEPSSGFFKKVSSILQYDNNGVLTDVPNRYYVSYYMYATCNIDDPLYCVVGQRVDSKLSEAIANQSVGNLNLSNPPTLQMKPLWQIIIKRNGTSEIVEQVTDLRLIRLLPAGNFEAQDHGALGGLSDDDHPQYMLNTNFEIASGVIVDQIEASSGILRTDLDSHISDTNNPHDITWTQVDKTTSDIADITTRSHTSLTDIGSNTHVQIDTKLDNLATASGNLNSRVSIIEDDYLTSANSGVLQEAIDSNTSDIADLQSASGNLDTRIDYIEAASGEWQDHLSNTNNPHNITWAQVDKTTSSLADITTKSHTVLSDIGNNTHAQIDSHISSTSNPHSVTKSQVGLSNVENTALSSWAGTTNITTLGTISTGVWNGTALTADKVPNHDNLNGFVANEHIDWTNATGINLSANNISAAGNLTVYGNTVYHDNIKYWTATKYYDSGTWLKLCQIDYTGSSNYQSVWIDGTIMQRAYGGRGAKAEFFISIEFQSGTTYQTRFSKTLYGSSSQILNVALKQTATDPNIYEVWIYAISRIQAHLKYYESQLNLCDLSVWGDVASGSPVDIAPNLNTYMNGPITISENFDTITITQDGNNPYIQWSDGELYLQAMGGGVDGVVHIAGNDIGAGKLILDQADGSDGLKIWQGRQYYYDGRSVIEAIGSAGLHLNMFASNNVYLFDLAEEGQTPQFVIRGYKSGDTARRSLYIKIDPSVNNQVLFSGVDTYAFDGVLSLGGDEHYPYANTFTNHWYHHRKRNKFTASGYQRLCKIDLTNNTYDGVILTGSIISHYYYNAKGRIDFTININRSNTIYNERFTKTLIKGNIDLFLKRMSTGVYEVWVRSVYGGEQRWVSDVQYFQMGSVADFDFSDEGETVTPNGETDIPPSETIEFANNVEFDGTVHTTGFITSSAGFSTGGTLSAGGGITTQGNFDIYGSYINLNATTASYITAKKDLVIDADIDGDGGRFLRLKCQGNEMINIDANNISFVENCYFDNPCTFNDFCYFYSNLNFVGTSNRKIEANKGLAINVDADGDSGLSLELQYDGDTKISITDSAIGFLNQCTFANTCYFNSNAIFGNYSTNTFTFNGRAIFRSVDTDGYDINDVIAGSTGEIVFNTDDEGFYGCISGGTTGNAEWVLLGGG